MWDVNNELLKIQIKTARSIDFGNAIAFSCRSVSNGKPHPYTPNEIDYYATFWEGKVYLYPSGIHCNEVKLKFSSKNSKLICINWARDYELEKILDINRQ